MCLSLSPATPQPHSLPCTSIHPPVLRTPRNTSGASPWQRSPVVEVEDLVGVEEFAEGGDEVQTLAAPALHIDKHHQRLHPFRDHVWLQHATGTCRQILTLTNTISSHIPAADPPSPANIHTQTFPLSLSLASMHANTHVRTHTHTHTQVG